MGPLITADDRLGLNCYGFRGECVGRWESGKSILVCIDKITCARMWHRIRPRWQAKLASIRAAIPANQSGLLELAEEEDRQKSTEEINKLWRQTQWMDETIMELIINEAQNEVADFGKWDFTIIPHRARMKQGFEVGGKSVPFVRQRPSGASD